MNNGVMETQCTQCTHKDVCMHKNDFLDIHNAVFNAEVYKNHEDGRVSMQKVTNFEFVRDIIIRCQYFTRYFPHITPNRGNDELEGKSDE